MPDTNSTPPADAPADQPMLCSHADIVREGRWPPAPAGVRWLSASQVAQKLQLNGTFTLAQWRQRGHGPAFVIMGRTARYREDMVDAWMMQQPVTPQMPSFNPRSLPRAG